jgi:hypothetical protein
MTDSAHANYRQNIYPLLLESDKMMMNGEAVTSLTDYYNHEAVKMYEAPKEKWLKWYQEKSVSDPVYACRLALWQLIPSWAKYEAGIIVVNKEEKKHDNSSSISSKTTAVVDTEDFLKQHPQYAMPPSKKAAPVNKPACIVM